MFEYEDLPVDKAWVKVDEIAKDRKAMGHNLCGMVEKVIKSGVLDERVRLDVHLTFVNDRGDRTDYTGGDLIKILDKAYINCRYPQNPKEYPRDYADTNERVWTDIHRTQELMEFSFGAGLNILNAIKNNFEVVIPRDGTYFAAVRDEDWKGFRRVFFQEDFKI